MSVQIQMRRGSAAQWSAANPTLAEGEIGLELDTQKFKMGTGVDAWNSLAYYSAGSSTVSSVNGQTGIVVLDTDDVSEGTTNKYYADSLARGAVSAGTGISYNSSTGVISSSITQYTDALARAAVSASGSLSYNSTTGVFSYTQPTNISTFTNDSGYLLPSAIGVTVQGYDANTVIDSSYVHTDNNYTTTEKSKLAGIAAGAEVNVNADWNAVSGDAQILNKPTLATVATTGAYSDLTGKPTLPSGTIVGTTDTQTLTNKRIDPRVSSTTSASSVTPDISSYDAYYFTAQAATLTINATTGGTPVAGDKLIFRIKDNGSSQTLSWTTSGTNSYRAIGVTLPTTTTAGKVTYVGCIYNATESYWDVVAVTTQA